MTTIIECWPSAATPDLKAIKTKQQAAWSSGDYAVVGTTLQIVGEQWQRHARCRPPLVRRHVHGLRRETVVPWTRASRRRGSFSHIPEGRRRAPSFRGWVLRCGRFDIRWNVQPRSEPYRERNATRVPIGRPYRPGQLDPRWLHRPNVQDDRKTSSTTSRG